MNQKSKKFQRKSFSVLFNTDHKGSIGGGDLYSHQIAECLSEVSEFRYFGHPYPRSFTKHHGFKAQFVNTSSLSDCDVFVSCSHFNIPSPIGKHRNILIVMFPDQNHAKFVQKYDTIICCSQFAAKYVQEYWKKKAYVVYPHIDRSVFYPPEVEPDRKSIISVGRFFEEQGGHSKKQTVLIEALAELDSFFHLSLVGSVYGDQDRIYLNKCKSLAKELNVNVSFYENVSQIELANLYRSSSVYWHANGYESQKPFETEHFGISIEEAVACGCVPIIHKSGGHLEHCGIAWLNIDELVEATFLCGEKRPGYRPVITNLFSKENMQQCLSDILLK